MMPSALFLPSDCTLRSHRFNLGFLGRWSDIERFHCYLDAGETLHMPTGTVVESADDAEWLSTAPRARSGHTAPVTSVDTVQSFAATSESRACGATYASATGPFIS
jgi:hypothetical protein